VADLVVDVPEVTDIHICVHVCVHDAGVGHQDDGHQRRSWRQGRAARCPFLTISLGTCHGSDGAGGALKQLKQQKGFQICPRLSKDS
jgi:hypothetical protein